LAQPENVQASPQRKYPRVKAPQGLVVAWQTGALRNVSYVDSLALGGLFIRTSKPAPVNSALSVRLEAPNGEVRARAVVRRVGSAPSHGMGIEFIAMNPEDRARLSHMLTPLLASH
jgi:hypothetical protein